MEKTLRLDLFDPKLALKERKQITFFQFQLAGNTRNPLCVANVDLEVVIRMYF
jgi:hypothetical protein